MWLHFSTLGMQIGLIAGFCGPEGIAPDLKEVIAEQTLELQLVS